MRCADVKPTQGMVHIRTSLFEHAEQCLEAALETHTVIGSILGQAFDLHHAGYLRIQEGEYDVAEDNLRQSATTPYPG